MLEGLEEEGVVSHIIELAILVIVFPVVDWKWQVRISFILRQDKGGALTRWSRCARQC